MATTRSNEEVHPRNALGFLTNPRRMNGLHFPRPLMRFALELILVSGHYACAIVAHFGRRPRSAGEGQLLAHVPELYHTTQWVDGKAAQLEMYRPGSHASN